TSGTTVTISGSGFIGTTSVKFNGVDASSFTIVSSNSIKATVPSAAASGPITVTTPSGTATSPTSFTVLPMITSFTPISGTSGTQVYISGSGFIGTTFVKFNGVDASSFTIVSRNTIKATVPVTATSGPITVTTLDGTATS